jgi:CHAT domain-containing protein/tetratricopeptide (TPR) repeat protein
MDDGSAIAKERLGRLRGKKLTILRRYSSGSSGGMTSRSDIVLQRDGRVTADLGVRAARSHLAMMLPPSSRTVRARGTLVLLALWACAGGPIRPAEPGATPDELRAAAALALMAVEEGRVAEQQMRWRADGGLRAARETSRFGRAMLARHTYDFDGARRQLERLAKQGSPAARAAALRALAELAAARTDRAGLPVALDAVQAATALGDSTGAAEAELLRGRLELRLGSADSSRAAYARAAALLPASAPGLRAVHACYVAFAERGTASAEAERRADEGLSLAADVGDRRAAGFCRFARAQVRHTRGRHLGALEDVDSAIALLDAAGDLGVAASAWQLRSYLLSDFLARPTDAAAAADSAIRRGRASGNRLAVAWAHVNLAQVQLRLGDHAAADSNAAIGETILGTIGDRWGLAMVLSFRAEAAHASGALALAERRYAELERRYQLLGLDEFLPECRTRLADLARRRGALVVADSLLELVSRDVRRTAFFGYDNDLLYQRALLQDRRGRHVEADSLLAAFAAATTAYPDLQFAAASRRAQVAAGAGLVADALRHLRRADSLLSRRRAALVQRDAQAMLLRAQRIDFTEGFGLALVVDRLAKAGAPRAAFEAAEVHRASVLLTGLLRRAMVERTESADAAADPRAHADLGLLPSHLAPGARLAEYVIGAADEPSTLLLAGPQGFEAHPLAVPNLAGRVQRFATALEQGRRPERLAASLARELLGPVHALLGTEVRRLLVVPDGPLHELPFEALSLADGRPLLAAAEVGVLPSARLWLLPTRAAAARPAVTAFGDPFFAPSRRLARLPESADEARTAAAAHPGGDARLAQDASERALKRLQTRPPSVIHLATHATVSDERLLGSTLHLAAGDGEDGELHAAEIAALQLRTALVVLSACRSGGGRIVQGEGRYGLVAPFLEAGAGAVLATRWAVRDSELVPMMAEFYAQLARGVTTLEALQATRTAALARGATPREWAALQLVGRGDLRPLGFSREASADATPDAERARLGDGP